jgi:isoleucyl-tRNA synthetase
MSSCMLSKQAVADYDEYDESGGKHSKYNQNYPEPSTFVEKVDQLKDIVPHIIAEFVKGYVLYNNNTDDNESKQIFTTAKTNLENILNEQFLLENNIGTNTSNINSDLARYYVELETMKKENKFLKKKLKIFDQHADTTDEMFGNYKEFYEIQYLRNWALALTICISLGVLSSIYNPVRPPKV